MGMTGDFRTGMVILLDNVLYLADECQYFKPGKGNTIIRTRLKNITTGAIVQRTFRSGDKVEEVAIDTVKMQYLYNDGEHYHMMNVNTFEQIIVPGDIIRDIQDFLKENTVLEVQLYNNSPIACRLPIFVDLQITHTEPGMKGDTVSSTTKPATLETGAIVQVPLFINNGETIKIDMRTKKYVERTKNA